MQTRNRSPFFLLSAPAALVALSLAALDPGPAAMGTIELKGSTVKKTVGTSGIPTTSPGPSLVGKLVNQTGQTIEDLTIDVIRADGDDDAPTGGDTTVSRPGDGGAFKSSIGTTHTSGGGVTANVEFSSGPTDIKPVSWNSRSRSPGSTESRSKCSSPPP